MEATLAEAIRSSGGGQMTRSAEVFLAGVCAKHLDPQRLAEALDNKAKNGKNG